MENLQKMVNSLAFQAHRLAFDANYLSPFSKRARENGINVLGKFCSSAFAILWNVISRLIVLACLFYSFIFVQILFP